MEVQIQVAALSDIDEIVRLNGVVQEVHVQMRPDIFRADWDMSALHAFWTSELASTDSIVALAIGDAGAVGYVWFKVYDRPGDALSFSSRRLYVHHIAVEGVVRRTGIASRLMDFVDQVARKREIKTIVLETWHFNDAAQSFFLSRGYVPTRTISTKTLASEGELPAPPELARNTGDGLMRGGAGTR
jgi:ribosomal protein S18 acetylase RimI-like enzyme